MLTDAHTTTGYDFDGVIVSAEMMVTELNASLSDLVVPGRKIITVRVSEAFN